MIGRENAIHQKSKTFAIRIVKMVTHVQKHRDYVAYPIFQQILKSGTSIGANIRESQYAESTDDFVHKLKIALKEANETEFWLDILFEGEYITSEQHESMVIDCTELIKLLIAIINKTNNNK
ncbi:MAG: four helix bundle protein [Bacteroidaceae bacterium]|nr:four helix bundle protein [Bacteroidaceae bacterium]